MGPREFVPNLDNSADLAKERMAQIRQIKPVITFRIASNEPNRLQLSQLILNRGKGKATLPHKFTDVRRFVVKHRKVTEGSARALSGTGHPRLPLPFSLVALAAMTA